MPYSPDASPSTEHQQITTAPTTPPTTRWTESIQQKTRISNSNNVAVVADRHVDRILEERAPQEEGPLVLAKISDDGIGIVTFNRKKPTNPCSQALMKEFSQIMQGLDKDSAVKAIVVWGGEDRSFCAGGDFNEVQTFVGGDETGEWIKNIVETFYINGSLKISKPVIGALDHNVIGTGLQLAITFDWRVATDRTTLLLPELKNKLACVIGATMLEVLNVPLLKAQEIILGCKPIKLETAENLGIINTVVKPEELLNTALDIAKQMGNYNLLQYQETKAVFKESLINKLQERLPKFIDTHRKCFATGAQKTFMQEILNKKFSSNDNNAAVTTSIEATKRGDMNFADFVNRPSPTCSIIPPPAQ